MAITINILVPNLAFGGYGMASCQVEILDGVTTTSSRLYYFNINEFSAFVDSVAVNYASIHFGQHHLSLSNGDYNVVQYNSSTKTNAYTAVSDLAQAVSELAP